MKTKSKVRRPDVAAAQKAKFVKREEERTRTLNERLISELDRALDLTEKLGWR